MGIGRNLLVRMKAEVRVSVARYPAPAVDWCDVARVTADMFPDVVLLQIFDFYMPLDGTLKDDDIEIWHTLVHVCRNWRNVVFGSPRRLNLQLYCTAETPVRRTLDVWPLLPMVVKVYSFDKWDNGNIFAALEHNDRISELVIFDIPSSKTEKAFAALQKPFPALTYLKFVFMIETAPVLPASFLGGSASGLKTLALDRIPFLGLPKLLLTATHLVHLRLHNIPHSGYISPEATVAALAVLTRLENFEIGFESPRSRPDRRSRRPPPTRTLLPVLTLLGFKGASEYLEDLVARINVPQLNNLTITFFLQLIFDCPQLTQFVRRTPMIKAQGEARVEFSNSDVTVTLPHISYREVKFGVSCTRSDWQLSSVAQVCSSSFTQTLIPTVERLFIETVRESWHRPLYWQDDIENSQWLELFQLFAAVKDLYVSSEFTPRITPALNELVGESVTEVLPALQTLFLEGPPVSGPVQEVIGRFVAARQLAGHPLAVSRSERFPEMGIARSSKNGTKGSKQWKCPHDGCNKSYGRRQEARRHMRDKHEVSPKCFICGIKWTRSAKIKEHLLSKHRHHFTEEERREIQRLRGLNNMIDLLERLEITRL
jgi:hypothetical protein